MLTGPGGCGFNFVIIAGEWLGAVLYYVGVGECRYSKVDPCRTAITASQ